MRWVSNRESVRKGAPSVLAIAETLIAMGLALWIAVHFGTVKHVIIGACIAPFLLLRTDESAALGLRTMDRIADRLDKLPEWLMILTTLLLFVPIRVFATVVTAARGPATVLRAIPGNWRRIVVATDSRTSPEILPTPDDAQIREELVISPGEMELYGIMRGRPKPNEVGLWVVFFVFVGLPPILYRWSLKSTAIIWFPLLWALRPVGPGDQPLKLRLRLFERSDLLRIVLLVSVAALLLLAGKLIFWNELAGAADAWNASLAGRILSIHVAPGVLEWWQVATALNSLIAIGLWLYVRSWLRHDEAGVPQRATVVEALLAWGLFVRRLLTTYTILCVGYLYLREAATWQLPALGGKPFPWM